MIPRPPPPLPDTFVHPRAFAHRGLHDASRGVIENTKPAFESAIAGVYGIECDLRPTSDGEPFVFHDLTLDRLVDATGSITDRTSAELGTLRYRGSDETILPFASLLELVDGRAPLLVEVKSEWDPPDPSFLAQIASLVSRYPGPLALMSFDPAVLSHLAELAPAVPRGLVSGSYGLDSTLPWWPDQLTTSRREGLRSMADFDDIGASFVAFEIAPLPTPHTAALRTRGVPVLTWTVRSLDPQSDERVRAAEYADAIIFEGFRPLSSECY